MKKKLKLSFIGKIRYKLYPYFSGSSWYHANFSVKKNMLDSNYWTVGLANTVKRSSLRLDTLDEYGSMINITGLAEYGLGLHELNRDDEQDKIVRFILTHLQSTTDFDMGIEYSYWRSFMHSSERNYFVTGMGQGLLLSFLCRFNLRKEQQGLDEVIERIANSFLVPFEKKNGFVRRLNRDSVIIEEYTTDRSLMQVLNGWCYGVFGLFDYLNYRKAVPNSGSCLEEKQCILESTLSTLRRVLPNYDAGFWSLYNLPDSGEKIVNLASWHYHAAHIALLNALWHMTGDDIYKAYATRFQYYSSVPLIRFRALFMKIVFTNFLKYGRLYKL